MVFTNLLCDKAMLPDSTFLIAIFKLLPDRLDRTKRIQTDSSQTSRLVQICCSEGIAWVCSDCVTLRATSNDGMVCFTRGRTCLYDEFALFSFCVSLLHVAV